MQTEVKPLFAAGTCEMYRTSQNFVCVLTKKTSPIEPPWGCFSGEKVPTPEEQKDWKSRLHRAVSVNICKVMCSDTLKHIKSQQSASGLSWCAGLQRIEDNECLCWGSWYLPPLTQMIRTTNEDHEKKLKGHCLFNLIPHIQSSCYKNKWSQSGLKHFLFYISYFYCLLRLLGWVKLVL